MFKNNQSTHNNTLFSYLARTLKCIIIAVKKTSFEVLNFVGAGDDSAEQNN